jgi:hypothetical protein
VSAFWCLGDAIIAQQGLQKELIARLEVVCDGRTISTRGVEWHLVANAPAILQRR